MSNVEFNNPLRNRLGFPPSRGTGGAAVATKQSAVLNEAVRARVATKQVAQEDTRFAEIKANPFHKIIFDTSVDEEVKAEQIAKTLTKETVKDFIQFDEWLSATRERMASELIALNDSKTTAEYHATLNDMGNDLLEFEKQGKPFTDILESSYTLRTNGVIIDAVQDAKEHKVKYAAITTSLQDTIDKVKSLVNETDRLLSENIVLANTKGMFGFGGQTSEAKSKQMQNEARLEVIKSDLIKLEEVRQDLLKQTDSLNNQTGDFAKEKAILREMLDVSGAEHQRRAEEYKATAQRFIEVSKKRVGSLRSSFESREEQIDRFKKSTKNLQMVYATLDQGVSKAFEGVQDQSAELAKEVPGETLLVKAKREQNKESIDEFARTLDSVKKNTIEAFASVSRQGVTVNSMKEGNDKAISTIRKVHTQGIAEVAENMSVMLEGIAGAALGEASGVAQQALDRMNKGTSVFAQREVIKQAMSVNEEIGSISRTMEGLAEMGETLTAARQIHKDNLAELRGLSNNLRELAQDVVGATQDAMAVNAELRDGQPTSNAKSTVSTNPLEI